MANIVKTNKKKRIAMAGAGFLGATALLLVPSVGEAGPSRKQTPIVDKKIKKVCMVHADFHARHPNLPMHKGIICPPASP